MCTRVINKIFTTKTKICLKHTNQKKERERKHTVFLLEVEQKQEKIHSYEDEEKDERLSLQ